jgi:hypothetical protein
MKSFKQFLEQVKNIKQISYPASVRHTIYNPLTGKSKSVPAGKAMPKNPGGGNGDSGNGNGD